MKSSVLSAGIGLSISIAACLISTGCQQNDDLYGTWQGTRDWKSFNTTNEAAARGMAAVDLTLKPGGGFVLVDLGMPFTGTWVRSGDTINLRVEMFMNVAIGKQPMSVQEASNFVVEYKEKTMSFRGDNEMQSITLKKRASTKS